MEGVGVGVGVGRTEVLEMDADLVHAARVRPAADHRGLAVVGQALELGATFLALGRDAAHADFIADHFDGLVARHRFAGRRRAQRHEDEKKKERKENDYKIREREREREKPAGIDGQLGKIALRNEWNAEN